MEKYYEIVAKQEKTKWNNSCQEPINRTVLLQWFPNSVREMLQGICWKNWVTAPILYIYIYKKGNNSKGNEILRQQFSGTVNIL
jgi:hypothetical protein